MTDEKQGIQAAAEVMGPGELPADPAEQLEMMPVIPLTPAALETGQELRSTGPGRPKGAINKRTAEWIRWYQAKGYTNPMDFWGEILSRDVAGLAKELKCDKLEALKVMAGAAAAAAPYLLQKLPLAIEAESKSIGILAIGHIQAGSEAADALAGMGINILPPGEKPEGEQNQAVTIAAEAKSHDEKSHGSTK